MDDFNFKNATLGKIPTALIRENAEALRVAVNKQDPDYVELVDSVRKRGILNPILVREIKDPVTGGKLYGLIDGLHRFNAAMDAGFSEVPAQIGSLEEGDLLEAQMLANVHRIETKAAQYSKALVKVLGSNPTLTIAELAGRLSKSPKWLQDRLGLVKLTDAIQKLVDDGKLVLVNAYALSKLPPEKQEELLNQAIAKSPAEFVGQADNVRRELAKAKREGRPAVAAFAPTERQQKLGLIKSERQIANDNPAESAVVKAAKANGVTTVEEAVAYTLNWVLHLDPVSIAKDKAEYDAEKANAAAEKERKAAVKKEAERIAAETLAAGASA